MVAEANRVEKILAGDLPSEELSVSHLKKFFIVDANSEHIDDDESEEERA